VSEHGTLQPVVAGAVAALVGFASTFALVLAGLRAVGADEAQGGLGPPDAVRGDGRDRDRARAALPHADQHRVVDAGRRAAHLRRLRAGRLRRGGYRPPLRPLLTSTGAATALGAPFGAHAINLAAITAALVAAPDAHPDPRRRWVASVSAGAAYLVLGLLAGVVTALVAGSPPILIEAVAGLALLGALGAALTAAAEDAAQREAVTITFAVSASAITVAGINAPFWGLVAGLAFLALQRTAPAARPAPEAA
jgi:predicted benzoate:H+ symporter BenE